MIALSVVSASSFATPQWDANKIYDGGSKVCHKSQIYDSIWLAKAGVEPGRNEYGPWLHDDLTQHCAGDITTQAVAIAVRSPAKKV
ncbi:MAG: chitodextrinase [Alteromonadaceae bacterium]|jgi:chitodextrinase